MAAYLKGRHHSSMHLHPVGLVPSDDWDEWGCGREH